MSSAIQDGPNRLGMHQNVVMGIWRLAGDKRGILVRSIGYKVLQGMFEALPMALLIYLINELRVEDLTRNQLIVSVCLMVCCASGQWVFAYLANKSAWLATFELFGWLRAELLSHVRRLPMSFHDKESTGNVVTVMTQDVSTVEGFAHEPMQTMIGAAVAPFIIFLVLSFQDGSMAVATMMSVFLSVPAFAWTNKVFMRLARERQAHQASASGKLIEYLQGLPVVRSFGLAGERLDLLRNSLDSFKSINNKMATQLAPLSALFLSTVFLGVPLVLFAGSYWMLGGQLDPAVFLIFAILSLRVYLPLIAATDGFESMRMADASLQRISALFDEPVEVQERDLDTVNLENYDVTFDEVTFNYEGQDRLMWSLNFTAGTNEVTAIVGPSGSGKSTILQLVSGLRTPILGSVRIGGYDIKSMPYHQLFDCVSYVFQDVYLFPGTLLDNIAFGEKIPDRDKAIQASKMAQAHDFISALPDGYDTLVQENGANLSRGEKQRISIARALLKDAPIILLDEATDALDASTERQVQEALAELVKDKTVIVVAHRLATIKAADQILVVNDGTISQVGTHSELSKAPGLYQNLWQAREKAAAWEII